MNAEPKKILVLRFSSLGDIVMLTPVLRCLRARFPHATIDIAVRSDFLDLVRFNPHVNRIWTLDRQSGWGGVRRLIRDLNAVEYDTVYDAHRSLRTRWMLPWLKASRKYTFRKRYLRRTLALVFKLPLLDSKRFLERFVEPLTPLGVRFDGRGPELVFDDTSEASGLAKAGIVADGRHRIALIPSAQWPGKRWPTERFRALAQMLLEKTSHQIIIFGGPGDSFCKSIAHGLDPERVVDTTGRLNLLESAAVLSHCSYAVANDTGLMHMADALGVPNVLIFGPTSGELGCLPHHPATRTVEQKLWCRPCSKNGQGPCIRGKRVCLERTDAPLVFRHAMQLEAQLGLGSVP